MSSALDLTGLLVEGLQIAQLLDKENQYYPQLIADIEAAIARGEDTESHLTELFLDDAFPTIHVTRRLKILKKWLEANPAVVVDILQAGR